MKSVKTDTIIIKILLGLFIIFQIACMTIIYAKSSPSGDEWFTYGLSNTVDAESLFMDLNWIERKTNGTGWVKTELFQQYLMVDSGEEFDFAAVIFNQKRDVHPPLYYLLVHLVCSLTPNTFCLFQSGVINLFSLAGINIILWKMGELFFKSDYERLLPTFVLCVSPVTGLLFEYDRMYALLAFFCVLLTYFQLRLFDNMQNRKLLISVTVITSLGCLTHYYFYIYLLAAFITFACINVLIEKNLKCLFPCVTAHCVGGAVALVLYPTAIKHMLFGYRGEQIIESLFENKLEGFITYGKLIDKYCFNGHFLSFVIVTVLLIVIGMFVKKISIKKQQKALGLLLGTIFVFYITISYVSYERLWSYISPIFVLVVFAIGILLSYALLGVTPKIKLIAGMLMILIMMGNSLASTMNAAISIDKYNNEVNAILETQQGRDCIFVYKRWNNLYNNRIIDLMHFDEVLSIPLEEIDTIPLQTKLGDRESEDKLVVYLWDKDNENLDKQISYIEKEMKMEAVLLFSSRNFSVFSMN